jgi:site-specific DNA-cytosine methylase
LNYIQCNPFDKRPTVVILECVARLRHHRQVDPDARAGTTYIQDELAKLGYAGEWANVGAKKFYLPQSRPRVYGLFLKMKSDRLSEECREERQRDVKTAMQLIRRMQPQAPPECSRSVLSRTPPIIHGSSESAASPVNPSWENTEWPEGGPKWPQAHAKYVKEKGLAATASQNYADFFAAALQAKLKPRAIEATWLRLLTMRQAGTVDISKDLFVATAGASVDYIQVRKDMFPCVTPHMTYVISDNGQLRLASGFDALAFQGVQSREMATHKLSSETSQSLLQDLAGNAFSATILAAFLVAAMVVM